jgi:hypothetical protein
MTYTTLKSTSDARYSAMRAAHDATMAEIVARIVRDRVESRALADAEVCDALRAVRELSRATVASLESKLEAL